MRQRPSASKTPQKSSPCVSSHCACRQIHLCKFAVVFDPKFCVSGGGIADDEHVPALRCTESNVRQIYSFGWRRYTYAPGRHKGGEVGRYVIGKIPSDFIAVQGDRA